MMQHFPALCVDDFYSDPDRVRQWALSLDYAPAPGGQWPGKRTKQLHEIDFQFFHDFSCKLFSLYFDLDKVNIDWTMHTHFQLIEPYDQDPNSIKNTGWVHYDDDTLFAGVIYLTPDIDPNTGTSLFEQHSPSPGIVSREAKEGFYKSGIDERYSEILGAHNSSFNETLIFKNVYNRLIAFDGEQAHKANSFYTSVPRLTQVFFVDKLEGDFPAYPLDKHRKYL